MIPDEPGFQSCKLSSIPTHESTQKMAGAIKFLPPFKLTVWNTDVLGQACI